MIGKLSWNIVLGAVTMLLTFMLSIGNNLFLTSLFHSIYAFIIAFILGFAVRYALGTLAGLKSLDDIPEEERLVGRHIDLSTPSENPMAPLESAAGPQEDAAGSSTGEDAFVPLQFQTLQTQQTDPEELTKAVRHLASKP